jgi:hypothetical protein
MAFLQSVMGAITDSQAEHAQVVDGEELLALYDRISAS